MKEAFELRMQLVYDGLSKIEGLKHNLPEGAFYFFPDVTSFFGKTYNGETIHDADDLCMYLIKEGGLSVVTGKAFGDENCIRLSYAASEDTLKEAVNRLAAALEKLR
jgi:aspartate aminotransferase